MKTKSRRVRWKQGFTLIELLVVMAVMAILLLLATPFYKGQAGKAKHTQILNDVRVVEDLVESYVLKHGQEVESWTESSSADLADAILDGRVYDRTGIIDDVEGATLKVVSPTFIKKESKSKLKGTFYMDENNNVYYVHDKVLIDRGLPPLPDPFKEGGVALAPFVYYQEQAKSNGADKSTEELLKDYLDNYYVVSEGKYTIKPGKDSEIQLLEEGMAAMLEEKPFTRFAEVETLLKRDFKNVCQVNYLPTEPYKKIVPLTVQDRYENYTWVSNLEYYKQASELGWMKYQINGDPNAFVAVHRSSTTSVITYEIVSSANERVFKYWSQGAVGYSWSTSLYAKYTVNAQGDYVVTIMTNSADSMGTYIIPGNNLLCADRPPAPVVKDSPLATGAPLVESRNTAVINFFKGKNMTPMQMIYAINGQSGMIFPQYIYALLNE